MLCLTNFTYFVIITVVFLSASVLLNCLYLNISVLLFPLQVFPPISVGRGVGSGGVQVNGCVAFICLLG